MARMRTYLGHKWRMKLKGTVVKELCVLGGRSLRPLSLPFRAGGGAVPRRGALAAWFLLPLPQLVFAGMLLFCLFLGGLLRIRLRTAPHFPAPLSAEALSSKQPTPPNTTRGSDSVSLSPCASMFRVSLCRCWSLPAAAANRTTRAVFSKNVK